MHEPHKMVLTSLIASLVLGVGILVYTYIYPKKKPNLIYLLILISLLPLLSILRQGTYESGDLSLHTKFAMQFFDNLQQGNFIPRWIGNHCSSYGCPSYIFLTILPYYFISFFHLLGFSFIASVKVLLILSYIFSGIGMYLWIKNELGERAGFVAAIFYLFAPYHLLDLHFRVSIGELSSMTFLPFLFLATKKLIDTNKPLYFVLTAVFMASLILSHQVTTFASVPLLFIYCIIVWLRNKKRKFSTILFTIISLLCGVLLSAFYWIPVLWEGKFTLFPIHPSISFHPLSSFLYSPERFGLLFQGHFGEYYLNIGYVQLIIIIASLYFLLRKKLQGKEKLLLMLSMTSFFIYFFMTQEISKSIWDFFPFLKSFQFSWRLLIEIMFVISIMAGIMTTKIKKTSFIIFLCSITILYTILNWGNRKMLPNINDTILRGQYVFNEHRGAGGIDIISPKWVDEYKPWIGKTPKYHIETLSGEVEFTSLSRKMTEHKYILQVKQDALIKENTYYFPGWTIFANNQPVHILYNNTLYPGVMTFKLKKGTYKVDVLFTNTTDRIIGEYISIFTVIGLCIYTLFFILKKQAKKKISFFRV